MYTKETSLFTDNCAFKLCILNTTRDQKMNFNNSTQSSSCNHPRVQNTCISMPSAKWQAKMGNWHAKIYLDGQTKGKILIGPKYSWIAKTNSDCTPAYTISCPTSSCNPALKISTPQSQNTIFNNYEPAPICF